MTDRRFTTLTLTASAALTALLLLALARHDHGLATGPTPPPKPGDTHTQRLSNTTVSFDLAYIPGGTFWMGSPENEPGRDPDTDLPRRQVTVSPFWMGKHEVTAELIHCWLSESRQAETGRTNFGQLPLSPAAERAVKPVPSGMPYVPIFRGGNDKLQPAVTLTAFGAQEFCRWLTLRTGRYYRLPTEAEWEFACRAGSDAAYPFGTDAARLGEFASFGGPSPAPGPVGSKRPNALGLYDMLGNVGEYVLDDWDGPYHSATAVDPWRPNRDRHYFTVRGGDVESDATQLRSASRRPHYLYGQEANEGSQSIRGNSGSTHFNGNGVPRAELTGLRVVSPVTRPAGADPRDRSIPYPHYGE
jgi:formylglycine-generating enzyme required for sulfatase activity